MTSTQLESIAWNMLAGIAVRVELATDYFFDKPGDYDYSSYDKYVDEDMNGVSDKCVCSGTHE